MLFQIVKNLPEDGIPNSCYLLKDDWDDYNYKTSFYLFYCAVSEKILKIGTVKIMKEDQEAGIRTKIPSDTFENLSDEFCSLGQDQSYYEELATFDADIRAQILVGIRDCVYNQNLYEAFKHQDCFRTSLARSVSETQIKRLFASILDGNAVLSNYKFKFIVEQASNQEIEISVKPESTPPTNVHVIIGRNGVGKTRLLSGLADALTNNINNQNDFSLAGKLEFDFTNNSLNQPIIESEQFSNLIVVAFSVFDGFTPLDSGSVSGDIRYEYVGLRKSSEEKSFKNDDELIQDFGRSLKVCFDGIRLKRWKKAISVLSSDPIFAEYELEHTLGTPDDHQKFCGYFALLSSGHKIILLTLTKLVELVDEKTLVLVDEPENHLHPPLLSSFIRALSELLINRNGVSLIATHSPVVLQEVPRSCVTLIDKVRGEYQFYRPETETFAENVGTLTREVFDLEVTNSGFHKLIDQHLVDASYENLLEQYNGQIGKEGRALARILALSKER